MRWSHHNVTCNVGLAGRGFWRRGPRNQKIQKEIGEEPLRSQPQQPQPADFHHSMSQPQFGPAFEPEPIPPVLNFRLPDDTPVKSSQDGADGRIDIELGGEDLCSLVPQPRALRISPHGIANPERVESAPILNLVLANNRTTISNDDLWGALYGLWLRKAEEDVMPFDLPDDIGNAAELRVYLSKLSD